MKTIVGIFILLVMFFENNAQVDNNKISIQWKIGGNIPDSEQHGLAPGLAGALIGVQNNHLIVAGGANFPDTMPWKGGTKKYHTNAYLFTVDQVEKNITLLKSGQLPIPIAYGASCSTPDGIVYAGGESERGILKSVWELKWNDQLTVRQLPELPLPLTNAASIYYKDWIVVAGGESIDGVSDKVFHLDLTNMDAGWQLMPPLPKPLSHFVMVIQSNGDQDCIYVIGGRRKHSGSISDLYSTVFQFGFESQTWETKAPLPFSLSAGTGLAVLQNRILIFGGDRGKTFNQVEKLNLLIRVESDIERKQQLIKQKNNLLATHPGFKGDVLMYNTKQDHWYVGDSIPFNTPVTTTACLIGPLLIIPSGEIKAGVRTPQILIGKLSAN